MQTQTITPTKESINALRIEVAEAVVRQYGAERRYAAALCELLPAEWYFVEHSDTSEAAKPVHAEKRALFEVLKAANHKNPSTVWARVRKYAQEEIEGPAQDGDAKQSDANARHARSLDLRLVEELSALWKACKRAESLTDKQRQAETYIGSALTAMGIDLSTIA